VDLHTIKAGNHGIGSSLPEPIDDICDLGGFQRARHRRVLHAALPGLRVRHPDLCIRRHSGRGDRQAVGMETLMAHTADVPELQEDPSAIPVNRIRDLTPAFDLLSGMDAGREGITLALA